MRALPCRFSVACFYRYHKVQAAFDARFAEINIAVSRRIAPVTGIIESCQPKFPACANIPKITAQAGSFPPYLKIEKRFDRHRLGVHK